MTSIRTHTLVYSETSSTEVLCPSGRPTEGYFVVEGKRHGTRLAEQRPSVGGHTRKVVVQSVYGWDDRACDGAPATVRACVVANGLLDSFLLRICCFLLLLLLRFF